MEIIRRTYEPTQCDGQSPDSSWFEQAAAAAGGAPKKEGAAHAKMPPSFRSQGKQKEKTHVANGGPNVALSLTLFT